MARIALPWPATCTGAVPRLYGCLFLLIPLLLAAGCAWHRSYPVPPEVTDAGVADRVLVPPDLNVNPVETVVKPGMPARPRSNPSSSHGLEPDRTTFALADAIAFALQYSPRLRSARAAIDRRGARSRSLFRLFCRKSMSCRSPASSPQPWRPAYPGPPASSSRATSARAPIPKPRSPCSGPCATSGGPAAATARRWRAKASLNSSSFEPTRPWSSTWRQITWTSCWPGHRAGYKRTPSAGRRRPWTTRWPGTREASRSGRMCCVPRSSCRRAGTRWSWPGKRSWTPWPA